MKLKKTDQFMVANEIIERIKFLESEIARMRSDDHRDSDYQDSLQERIEQYEKELEELGG